jgi:hypothetical protein
LRQICPTISHWRREKFPELSVILFEHFTFFLKSLYPSFFCFPSASQPISFPTVFLSSATISNNSQGEFSPPWHFYKPSPFLPLP